MKKNSLHTRARHTSLNDNDARARIGKIFSSRRDVANRQAWLAHIGMNCHEAPNLSSSNVARTPYPVGPAPQSTGD